ncbi:hypothetical protein A2U01_0087246, partial [Trifolium medium]|nr:hypothetical protein [Trifolium medium]
EELTEIHGTISPNSPRPARYRRYGKGMAVMHAQWNYPDVDEA